MGFRLFRKADQKLKVLLGITLAEARLIRYIS